ncbi:MAG: hypothetical protein KIT84_09435 [Labilithrix sp.]|nr:hypothetical protein [Labilithrix sp.]MCW5811223.1 hypothetical protein [Labilithrix sp.]
MLRRALLLVTLALLAPACGASDDEGVKPLSTRNGTSSSSSSSGGSDDDDDSVLPELDAGSPDTGSGPSEQASNFRGILSATPTVPFGGVAPHCSYDVTMRNVEMELVITPSGSVISGSAKNDMVERLVGTCMYAPLGSKPQTFALAQVNGPDLTFRGSGGPRTELRATLTKTGASWEAAVTWERLDQTADLKWVVKSKLTLGPR